MQATDGDLFRGGNDASDVLLLIDNSKHKGNNTTYTQHQTNDSDNNNTNTQKISSPSDSILLNKLSKPHSTQKHTKRKITTPDSTNIDSITTVPASVVNDIKVLNIRDTIQMTNLDNMEIKNLKHVKDPSSINPQHSQSKHTHWQLQKDNTMEYDIISTFPLHRKRTDISSDKHTQHECRIQQHNATLPKPPTQIQTKCAYHRYMPPHPALTRMIPPETILLHRTWKTTMKAYNVILHN